MYSSSWLAIICFFNVDVYKNDLLQFEMKQGNFFLFWEFFSFIFFFFLLSISGFSQSYLGNITKQVNFREGPGSDYEIIKSLKPGSQIFISSLDTDDDFYNEYGEYIKK